MEDTVCSSLVRLISTFLEMDDIAAGAIGGAIAGVVAAGILAFLGQLHRWQTRRRDEVNIRDVVTRGRERVMESRETHYSGPDVTMSADEIRAAQYNLMIRQLNVELERTTPNLRHTQKRDIYDALDWFRTEFLNLKTDNAGNGVFVDDLPEGRWPVPTMAEDAARQRFERLEAIKWLKLKPYNAKSPK